MRPPRATTNSPGSCQGLSTSALSVPRRADRPTSSASASSPGCHAKSCRSWGGVPSSRPNAPYPAGSPGACPPGPPARRPAIPLLPPAPGPQPCSSRRRHARQRRDDLAAVDLDLLLLVAVHEVEVELVDARRGQFAQLAAGGG